MSLFEHLTSSELQSAQGRVHHRIDGRTKDAADFAFLAPDSWRVRHLSGAEIITMGSACWRRTGPAGPWTFDRALGGAGVHHTGYLRAILFPDRLTPLADPASKVGVLERSSDGSLRVRVEHVEPASGTMTVDVAPDGRVRRLAGGQDGHTIEIELDADFEHAPPPEVFDPATAWPVDESS